MVKINFVPPDYLLVFVILEFVLHYFFPLIQIVYMPFNYIGILFVGLGIFLNNIWVYFVLKKNKISFNVSHAPNKFISTGPFKFSRNPTYFGMFLILLGTAILLGSFTPFFMPFLFLILTDKFTIQKEEKILAKRFPKKFLNYKKNVRKWI